MLVDELRMTVSAQENAEIIKPRHDALKFHAVHKKYRERRLALPNVIEKCILKAWRAFCRHGLPRPFWSTRTLVSGAGILLNRPLECIRRDCKAIPQVF